MFNYYTEYYNVIIQFNSKTLFKDGDPVSSQPIFSGGIYTYNNNKHYYYMYIYIIQNNTGSSDKHRQTQLTLSYKNISINTYTMYIQTCTLITLNHLCIKRNNT